MTVTQLRAAWQCAVDLAASATSEANAAMLVEMLVRWQVHTHPITDICGVITYMLNVQQSRSLHICIAFPGRLEVCCGPESIGA